MGALSFSAAAWKVKPRDAWIGWSSLQREKNLHLVVNNSRFLILPWVQVKNLASKILSLAVQKLPEDWEKTYGYRPVLLETFVEKDRFAGTCYRAAN
ncbi:MAG: Druantia anti-phage system protein DruA [Desulfotomaculales bacterium]